MRDFTLRTYKRLLEALEAADYTFLTFEHYCTLRQSAKPLPERFVVLRHDVDKRPAYAVQMAELEAKMNIRASYYFRIVPESNVPECIKRIAQLRHEIGYHYEDMSLCGGDAEKAYAHFVDALAYFRQFYPVQTCCMHGAPMSQFDSRALWDSYDYHDERLIGEPYYDVDFSNVFYLTDTGRCWDGYNVSVRDKIPKYQDLWTAAGWVFHHTKDILEGIDSQSFPPQVMITTHPQRWTDSWWSWMAEWGLQHLKNIVKAVMVNRSK